MELMKIMGLSDNKKKLLAKANERFSLVSEPDTGKFSYLPGWLDHVSYRYEKEFKNEFPRRYYHYDRGTVIRVDFGVNMGSEFSFVHFAIVLDKKDNSRKKTLTVLPLTSKQKKGRFSLGKEIFNQTLVLLQERYIENYKRLVSLMKQYSELQKKDPNSCNFDHDIKETKNKLLEFKSDLAELNKVLDIYKDYNKDSFVRLSDVTTISKFRIRRINKFDPSGKIKLSEQQMAEISDELMKLYISGRTIDDK